MEPENYLAWLARDIVRNLSYTSLVYNNPKVAIVELLDNKEAFFAYEKEQKTPEALINYIDSIVKSSISVEDKIEALLKIRYISVYVDDKSDKRDIVLQLLNRTIKKIELKTKISDELNDAINAITIESKNWKIQNSKSFKPYHYNQLVSDFIKYNEFEVLEGTDPLKWKSDTLQGLSPNYNHRTHTLISSIIYATSVRFDNYNDEQLQVLLYLFSVIRTNYVNGYLEILPNRKWSHSLADLRENKSIMMYSAKIIHASCAMISILHAVPIDYFFLAQIIASFSEIPAHAAKHLSSPMTLYIGIAQLRSNIVVSTKIAAESVATESPNISRLEESQIREWEQEMSEYPFQSSRMVRMMKKNIFDVSVDMFYAIFNCFSATFHVGHRIDNPQDAIEAQVKVEYTSDVDKEMYDQYYFLLKRMLTDQLAEYAEEMYFKYNSDVTAESLAAMANSSNGYSRSVTFLDREIKTTKKMLHLDDDLSKNLNFTNIGDQIKKGIPMGTRNVPARQTRGIFILSWQVAAIQHTIAEFLYKKAKKGGFGATFAEAYVAKAATLTYGILAEATSKADQLILYTDVSQWDASQHNTEPYRSAWINAIKEARTKYKINYNQEPVVLGMNVLDKMIEIQEALLNSNLIVESQGSKRQPLRIKYHGVASGEKTTKIGNSFANVALITTVFNNLTNTMPSIRVNHMRVDGDDNVVTMYTANRIDEVQENIKEKYKRMNAKVKALASYTGLEMAKRFIICGKIFERGAISIFTAERPYGTDLSVQSTTGSLIYSAAVNAYRGFGDNYLNFMTDVLVPPSASVKITGRLRSLLSPVTLYSTGPLSFEITPYGLGGRMRLFSLSKENMELYKILTSSLAISVQPDEIKKYSSTPQFKARVDRMISSVQIAMKSEAKIITSILRDKEEQKTLGVPNVATTKNRQQIEKARKTLSLPKETLPKVTKYYPEEIFHLILRNSTFTIPKLNTMTKVYMNNSANITKLQQQLGVRVSSGIQVHRPVNTLLKLVEKHSPIKISPSDLVLYSKKYDLTNLNGKKQFLIDLGISGNELRFYLNSKLLFHDLLLSKYDKLYESPGFGATQLNALPLDLTAAEKVFSIKLNLPNTYYELLMLILLYEYVNFVMFTGDTFRAVCIPESQTINAKLVKTVMTMIDNIQLDTVMFSDNIY
ncbi:VP1 [Adult diarrheal rotavirus strain J19]|uniref:RNA-directed RNA polymerase n=1 Tax=Rotavirus X (strain RVX/Human/China/NADRV-J19/1997/GXP[X]) TaxID=335103 RepID=RDRP_ROTJ1|nr:VP1 [Adult diarrheal rotavirus strain J19]Q45UG0.1 RecName: Full=RNA-directed RNA polymerase; AltName: Full=Protein VP1 [Adult diarrheal rotavirus strain J19]AAZ03485.1 VP1 [Adult diarrheal rotavirus strain J19]